MRGAEQFIADEPTAPAPDAEDAERQAPRGDGRRGGVVASEDAAGIVEAEDDSDQPEREDAGDEPADVARVDGAKRNGDRA